MYICRMIDEVIDLYTHKNFGIEELCSKFKVGKLKIKKILLDNNIPLRKKGGQVKNIDLPFNYERYQDKVLKCKKTGKIFNDIDNKSGSIFIHLNNIYDLPKISKFKRNIITKTTGLYWYDQYFDIIDKEIDTKKYWCCELCDYKSVDTRNLSGAISKHLNNEHNVSIYDYVKTHPIDDVVLKYSNINLEDENTFIKCSICEKPLMYISQQHLDTHKIKMYDYKEKFGNVICEKFRLDFNKNGQKGRENITNNFSSKGQLEVVDYIRELGFEVKVNDKKTLKGVEIDVFISELNIGFEYNGLYWHSEKMGKHKQYHLDKQKLGLNNGVKIYHIFSDEWLNKKDIVKNKIKHILGKSENPIYGRKCIIKEITTKEKDEFLINNHIQGIDKGSIKLGGFYNDELVGVMTFSHPRISTGGKKEEDTYEIVRFSSKNVIGLGSKLLKYFIKNYNPKTIISYADKRWSFNTEKSIYNKMGFTFVGDTVPNFWYVKHDDKRFHRYTYRKDVLVKKGFDKNKSGDLIMKELGYLKVWDCGNLKFRLDINNG